LLLDSVIPARLVPVQTVGLAPTRSTGRTDHLCATATLPTAGGAVIARVFNRFVSVNDQHNISGSMAGKMQQSRDAAVSSRYRAGGRAVASRLAADPGSRHSAKLAVPSVTTRAAWHGHPPACHPLDITAGPPQGPMFAQRWRDLMTAIRDCGVACRQIIGLDDRPWP